MTNQSRNGALRSLTLDGDASMCVVCDVNLGRRGFLGLAGAGIAASLLPTSAFAAGGPTTSLTADQALA